MSQKPALAKPPCDCAQAPVFDLDPAAVGELVIRLGALSAALGHTHITSSIRDYIHPGAGDSPEIHFLRDILTHKPADYAGRWYNGESGAGHIAATGVGIQLGASL